MTAGRRVPAAALPVLLAACLVLPGCTLLRVAGAWTQSKGGFTACTPDPRILCEPGSEALAAAAAADLPAALARVTQRQPLVTDPVAGAPPGFAAPLIVYTYASRERYAAHSGAHPLTLGATALQAVHLSPRLLAFAAWRAALLTHELSHLQLMQQLGALRWAGLPGWFHEGLATWVSQGGGAGAVGDDEARQALREGRRFEPEPSQSIFHFKSAGTWGLGPHLYYRQCELFVRHLHDLDGAAFMRMLRAVAGGDDLGPALQAAYGLPLPALWARFLAGLGAPS